MENIRKQQQQVSADRGRDPIGKATLGFCHQEVSSETLVDDQSQRLLRSGSDSTNISVKSDDARSVVMKAQKLAGSKPSDQLKEDPTSARQTKAPEVKQANQRENTERSPLHGEVSGGKTFDFDTRVVEANEWRKGTPLASNTISDVLRNRLDLIDASIGMKGALGGDFSVGTPKWVKAQEELKPELMGFAKWKKFLVMQFRDKIDPYQPLKEEEPKRTLEAYTREVEEYYAERIRKANEKLPMAVRQKALRTVQYKIAQEVCTLGNWTDELVVQALQPVYGLENSCELVGALVTEMKRKGATKTEVVVSNRYKVLECEGPSESKEEEEKTTHGRTEHTLNPQSVKNAATTVEVEGFLEPVKVKGDSSLKQRAPPVTNDKVVEEEVKQDEKEGTAEVKTEVKPDNSYWGTRIRDHKSESAPLSRNVPPEVMDVNQSYEDLSRTENDDLILYFEEKPQSKPIPIEQVTSATTMLEYKGVHYRYDGDNWFPEDGGEALPEHVKVHNEESITITCKRYEDGIAVGDGTKIVKLKSRYISRKVTVKALDYRMFAGVQRFLRDTRDTLTFIGSLGNNEEYIRTLYSYKSETRERVIIYLPALRSIRSKFVSKITDTNNGVILKKILDEHSSVPVNILLDTAVYFIELRALAQKRHGGIVDAAVEFLQDKRAWCPPADYEQGALTTDTTKRYYTEEGIYKFADIDECYSLMKEGITCNARLKYVRSDSSYEKYTDPITTNSMYEPVSHAEAEKAARRGAFLDEEGLHFSGSATERPASWCTLGTHYATQMGIISHSCDIEYAKAARRLYEPRTKDPDLRERGGKVAALTLNFLGPMLEQASQYGGRPTFDARKELKALTASIKKVDKGYVG